MSNNDNAVINYASQNMQNDRNRLICGYMRWSPYSGRPETGRIINDAPPAPNIITLHAD